LQSSNGVAFLNVKAEDVSSSTWHACAVSESTRRQFTSSPI